MAIKSPFTNEPVAPPQKSESPKVAIDAKTSAPSLANAAPSASGEEKDAKNGATKSGYYIGKFSDTPTDTDRLYKKATSKGKKPKKKMTPKEFILTCDVPRRVRTVLTIQNPEVLQKVAEIEAKNKALAEDIAAGRISESSIQDPHLLKAIKGKKEPKKIRVSKMSMRLVNRYGISSKVFSEALPTKKLLNYRMLFTDPPIENMSDEEVSKNIRLLFLAYGDHTFPHKLDKFVQFLRKNMCSGISDEQLERLMRIITDKEYITILPRDKIKVNLLVERPVINQLLAKRYNWKT
jgi:hypothetical protein